MATEIVGERNRYELGIEQILKFIPHRAPFLLVDRVLEIIPSTDLENRNFGEAHIGTRVKAQKCLTYNEDFFRGHFPDYPIMPGVLILECMAQTSCFSLYPFLEKDLEKLARDFKVIFVGVDEARFRKPVIPGDVLIIDTVVTKCRSKIWGFDCTASVNGKKVAEAKILANLMANPT